MKYGFSVGQELYNQDLIWVARSTVLDTVIGQGATAEEALRELEANEAAWLELAPELGLDIPEARAIVPKKYSGKTTLRLSAFEHLRAANNADSLGVSLNQYLCDAVASYNSQFEERCKISSGSNSEYSSIRSTIVVLPPNMINYGSLNSPFEFDTVKVN